MKKINIIVIVILIIVGISLFGYYAYSKGYFDSELSFCKSMGDNGFSQACVNVLAVKRNDIAICKKAFNNFLGMGSDYGDCVSYYAEQTGDKNACDLRIEKDIWGKKFYYGSRDLCLIEVVKKNPDPEICKILSSQPYKNSCYYNLAVNHGLTYYCGSIIKLEDKNFGAKWTEESINMCTTYARNKYWENQEKNGTG